MLSLRCVDACLIIFSNYSRLLYPSHGVNYSTVGYYLCLERVIDCLYLWFSGGSGYAALIGRAPAIYECLLSWLPPGSASHWNFSWRSWVMVFMSVGPSGVANFNLYSFTYLQYLSRCLRNSMCLGRELLQYLDNMLSAYIIVINVCTITYISCLTTLL